MAQNRRRIGLTKLPGAPYHPLRGDKDNMRQDGTSPFCAMFQVASDDVYDDYVICRGFDTRILKFIDYEEGNDDKPGISVAKPFGNRTAGTYEIGEVYPAFLPTQGNADFTDFRQVTYVPPSPIAVMWRVGQNPGVVEDGSELDGGQPEDLDATIEILYDHNDKVINWLLIDSSFPIRAYETPSGGIAGKSGNTLSSAFCTLLDLSSGTRVVTAKTRSVYNPFFGAIAGSVDIIAARFNGIWIAIAEDCDDPGTGGGILPAPAIAEHTVTDSTYTAGSNGEEIILADSTSNSITITLDKDELIDLHVKWIAGGNTVTIDGDGDDIDGSATLVLGSLYDSTHLVYSSPNAEWYVV
jgi:hypothetical protein